MGKSFAASIIAELVFSPATVLIHNDAALNTSSGLRGLLFIAQTPSALRFLLCAPAPQPEDGTFIRAYDCGQT